jgi:type II secretory pathway pseudopilin PulG
LVNETQANTDQPEELRRDTRVGTREPDLLSHDETITPPPPAVGAAPKQRASCLLRLLVILALLSGLASLALSGFLLYSLNNVRQAALGSLDAALEALEGLENKGFHYEYPFSGNLPIAVEIPVQEDLMIPVQGDFAVNTDVRVPIDAGVLGTFVLNVPIDTSIPLDVKVPVQISQTVAISTNIPLSLTVPIDIMTDDPPVQRFVGELRRWLLELRDSFQVTVPLPQLGSE